VRKVKKSKPPGKEVGGAIEKPLRTGQGKEEPFYILLPLEGTDFSTKRKETFGSP